MDLNSHPAWCAVFSQEDLEVNIFNIFTIKLLIFSDYLLYTFVGS